VVDSSLLARQYQAAIFEEHYVRQSTLCSVYNGSSTGPGYSVVVCFPEPPDCTNACLRQEVHGKVTKSLLSNDHIRFVFDDLCANVLDVFLLHLQQGSPEVNAASYHGLAAYGW